MGKDYGMEERFTIREVLGQKEGLYFSAQAANGGA
jgi:hypothetical protein